LLYCAARATNSTKSCPTSPEVQETLHLLSQRSLSVDYPLDYCPQALWFTLALHTLRPTFHILDSKCLAPRAPGASPYHPCPGGVHFSGS